MPGNRKVTFSLLRGFTIRFEVEHKTVTLRVTSSGRERVTVDGVTVSEKREPSTVCMHAFEMSGGSYQIALENCGLPGHERELECSLYGNGVRIRKYRIFPRERYSFAYSLGTGVLIFLAWPLLAVFGDLLGLPQWYFTASVVIVVAVFIAFLATGPGYGYEEADA